MPYKRYDITNTYSSRGKRKNDNIAVKTVFLCLIPLLIIAVILGGAYVSYLIIVDDMPDKEAVVPVATPDSSVVHEAELLRVVNESDPLDSKYVPELSEVNGVEVNALAAPSLEKMIKEAADSGVNLKIKAGYVSYDEQAKLHDKTFEKLKAEGNLSQIRAEAETKKVCPVEGCSECQTGLLIEFDAPVGSDSYKWLVKYCVNYGFTLRYPEYKSDITGMSYNPQLYRYVGESAAANLRRYDMSLEEYAAHISIR